jgi:hypothetical protein
MTGVLTSQDVGAPKLPLRLSAEVRQIKEGNPIIGPSMVVTNRHMRDVLMVKAHQRRPRMSDLARQLHRLASVLVEQIEDCSNPGAFK